MMELMVPKFRPDLSVRLNLARAGGGGIHLIFFSGMVAELLGGSRFNFAQFMGHPLRTFSKKCWAGSDQVTEL